MGENQGIDSRARCQREGVAQFKGEFIENRGRRSAARRVQVSFYLVDVITAHGDDIHPGEAELLVVDTVATKLEALKWCRADLAIVEAQQTKLGLCFENELADDGGVPFRIEAPFVVFQVAEALFGRLIGIVAIAVEQRIGRSELYRQGDARTFLWEDGVVDGRSGNGLPDTKVVVIAPLYDFAIIRAK